MCSKSYEDPNEIRNMDVCSVKHDIRRGIFRCMQRGLNFTAQWLSEINCSLKGDVNPMNPTHFGYPDEDDLREIEIYYYAKMLFDRTEFDRCAYFLSKCTSYLGRFLYRYARYLSAEKKHILCMVDPSPFPDKKQFKVLQELYIEFKEDKDNLDGFELYLYGIVLKALGQTSDAIKILLQAIDKEPVHWGTWLELLSLITDKSQIDTYSLPNHWIKYFFIGRAYFDHDLSRNALCVYTNLENFGFNNCNYIKIQKAMALLNQKHTEMAIEMLCEVWKNDPMRIDYVEVLASIYHNVENVNDLCSLAEKVLDINKFTTESNIVIGIYYSARLEHQKAIKYFTTALQINPRCLSAWSLLGHQYFAINNLIGSVECYRNALEVNRRDYRAWFGLGQTYDVLRYPIFSLHYYKQAKRFRPNDCTLLLAIGDAYEKLEKYYHATKYYQKARTGDKEGIALLKLAKLYNKINRPDQAAIAYAYYATDITKTDSSELGKAFKYLAHHYMEKNDLLDAKLYAKKCLQYIETKEDGEAMLKVIESQLQIKAKEREMDKQKDKNPQGHQR